MSLLLALLMICVAVAGAAVVLTRDPHRQVFALAGNGLALAVLFFALQAPDVALSEVAVGTVATPLMLLATLTAIKIQASRK